VYDAGNIASVTAIPNEGYHFTCWSNGSTENPITFTVNCNVTLVANFDLGAGGIGYTDQNSPLVTSCEGGIVVEGVENSAVRIYDITGRLVKQVLMNRNPLRLEVQQAGVYLVQVGDSPVQRVVVAMWLIAV